MTDIRSKLQAKQAKLSTVHKRLPLQQPYQACETTIKSVIHAYNVL
jgi:hypothetical protein